MQVCSVILERAIDDVLTRCTGIAWLAAVGNPILFGQIGLV
jgi:hypothetical protein